MIDEHTLDYHPSPSELTLRLRPLILLWFHNCHVFGFCFLCHNLVSSMLKYEASLTQLILKKFSLKSILYRNNYMKDQTLLYPIFWPFHPAYAKLNLYPCIFSHFKNFHSPPLISNITIIQTMLSQAKLPSHFAFQNHTVWLSWVWLSYSMVIRLSKILIKPALRSHLTWS